MFDDGLAFGGFWLLSPKCNSCGNRLQAVPGYTDVVKGTKFDCPERCHPENYRDIEGVRA